jgi:short-subunit dehydrogenase involved in D-alanine esterification of teichoic acids
MIEKVLITGGNKGIGQALTKMFWLAIESPEYINETTIDINNGAYPR